MFTPKIGEDFQFDTLFRYVGSTFQLEVSFSVFFFPHLDLRAFF